MKHKLLKELLALTLSVGLISIGPQQAQAKTTNHKPKVTLKITSKKKDGNLQANNDGTLILEGKVNKKAKIKVKNATKSIQDDEFDHYTKKVKKGRFSLAVPMNLSEDGFSGNRIKIFAKSGKKKSKTKEYTVVLTNNNFQPKTKNGYKKDNNTAKANNAKTKLKNDIEAYGQNNHIDHVNIASGKVLVYMTDDTNNMSINDFKTLAKQIYDHSVELGHQDEFAVYDMNFFVGSQIFAKVDANTKTVTMLGEN